MNLIKLKQISGGTTLQNNVATHSTEIETLQTKVEDLETNTSGLSDLTTEFNSHINNTDNPHGVTASQVGLGNLTNDAQVKRTEMGVASGVATLDENGQVVSSQLPTFATVATTGTAADVTVADAGDNFTANNVEEVLAEIASQLTDVLNTAGAVTVTTDSDNENYAMVYTFTQNAETIATINIPKDMVVSDGTVTTLTESDGTHDAGTYMVLTLANSENSEVWIPADSLVTYVTGGTSADGMLTASVSDDHVVTVVINDGTVTAAKLDTGVNESLTLANSAIQTITVAGTELTNNGELTTDDLKTALGLESAAYMTIEAVKEAVEADDTKTVLQQFTVSEASEDGATSFTVTMTPDSGYEIVSGSLGKVIVNTAVYVVTAATSVVVEAGFGLELDDEVYVEFDEVPTTA